MRECACACEVGEGNEGLAVKGSRAVPEYERRGVGVGTSERKGVWEASLQIIYYIPFHVLEDIWAKNETSFSLHLLLDCGPFHSVAPRNQPPGPWDLFALYK